MKKGLLTILAVVAGLAVLGFLLFSGTYNSLVTQDESVKSAWAQVQNVYQRRLDLIPNLVETVKGYAAHEKTTLEGVVEARSKIAQMRVTPEIINNPAQLAQFQAAQGSLGASLSRLLVVAERYPDLKANEQFLMLQNQLEGTENRITVERQRYNDAAKDFNVTVRRFPTNLIARFMNFQAKAYFEADKEAAQVPQVKF